MPLFWWRHPRGRDSFATWGDLVELPRVVVTFERGDALWRVDKTFVQGTRAKAFLDSSTDGGTRFARVAEGRDVEGKLRELLSWGLFRQAAAGHRQRVTPT